jgi:hypothetical protein
MTEVWSNFANQPQYCMAQKCHLAGAVQIRVLFGVPVNGLRNSMSPLPRVLFDESGSTVPDHRMVK